MVESHVLRCSKSLSQEGTVCVAHGTEEQGQWPRADPTYSHSPLFFFYSKSFLLEHVVFVLSNALCQ